MSNHSNDPRTAAAGCGAGRANPIGKPRPVVLSVIASTMASAP